MARIRTIKPEFFRHEELFEAEKKTGLPLRVAFAGLFTVADREGRFKWKPTQIKFDVLPYDDVDFEQVLKALYQFEFINFYQVGGKKYGVIPSFKDHQVINNKESKSLLPEPPIENTRLSRVDHASLTEGKEGKGRERNIQTCAALAEIFGRDFEKDPTKVMPDLVPWYKEIQTQAAKVISTYGDKAPAQIRAYIKHCKQTERKMIGTVWKCADTIIQADWITLSSPEPVPRGSPYTAAEKDKDLWTEDAWLEFYHKQILNDPEFRKHFQITIP